MKEKTTQKNPIEQAAELIPEEIKEGVTRVGKAAAKGFVDGAATELGKIIDGFGKQPSKKKKRKKPSKEDWG